MLITSFSSTSHNVVFWLINVVNHDQRIFNVGTTSYACWETSFQDYAYVLLKGITCFVILHFRSRHPLSCLLRYGAPSVCRCQPNPRPCRVMAKVPITAMCVQNWLFLCLGSDHCSPICSKI